MHRNLFAAEFWSCWQPHRCLITDRSIPVPEGISAGLNMDQRPEAEIKQDQPKLVLFFVLVKLTSD